MRPTLLLLPLAALLAAAAVPAAAQTATARVRASATVVPRVVVDAPGMLAGERDASGNASVTGRVSGSGSARPVVTVSGGRAASGCATEGTRDAPSPAGPAAEPRWDAVLTCRVEGASPAEPGAEPAPVTVTVAVLG